MKIRYTLLLLLCLNVVSAQEIKVLQNIKLTDIDQQKCFFPVISADGSKIVYTSENYSGLYLLDVKTKQTKQISDKAGAGYMPVFAGSGAQLFYRTDTIINYRKYTAIYESVLDKRGLNQIENFKRIVTPMQIVNNELVYTAGGLFTRAPINDLKSESNEPFVYVCIEDSKIAVYDDTAKILLTPLDDGNYIWARLSPDKQKIVFTLAGNGTYICDTQGENLVKLGYLNAPAWLSDLWVVGMTDKDDGNVVTESDIVAISYDGRVVIPLTQTNDRIEMYPQCSANHQIVYHTLDGEIWMMQLKMRK